MERLASSLSHGLAGCLWGLSCLLKRISENAVVAQEQQEIQAMVPFLTKRIVEGGVARPGARAAIMLGSTS